MPASWILFDVGGVLELVDDVTWPVAYVARCADRLSITVEEFESRLATTQLPDAGTRSGVEDDFWRVLGSAVGAGQDVLSVMREDFWDAYCGTANVELIDCARSLVGRAGLAILSNSADGAREQEERRYGFSAIFDPICYSHEIGVNKPDPRVYRRTLDAMGAQAEQVLFIDNRPENVEAARRLGMQAVVHADNQATIAMINSWISGTRAVQA
ncbi:HAD-IA family hydrolase [Microlunatus sp. Gsoil 973]|uniref:HAD-IA family hydrolase n=1 Tax=Microlunatus sp. Gsoil 973 TaxID=2672569 RepID=UPI001E2972F3|nr:HAD-IA family hydrolase [Microlunatus sp. Gsoil 973]